MASGLKQTTAKMSTLPPGGRELLTASYGWPATNLHQKHLPAKQETAPLLRPEHGTCESRAREATGLVLGPKIRRAVEAEL